MTTCYLNIPNKYKLFTIEALLFDYHNEIINLIKSQIEKDGLVNFGLYLNIGVKMIKNIIGQNESEQYLYVNTPRYILVKTEIREVYDILTQYILEHFEKYFENVEGSGMIMDSIHCMSFSYHKILLRSNIRGDVKWPLQQTSRLIYNPSNGNCLIKCIAASVKQQQLLKDKKKVRWWVIKKQFKDLKSCQRILNIPKLKDPIDLEYINILERHNKVKINIYKLNKHIYDDDIYDFNIDLYFKSKYSCRRHFKKIYLILYTENNQTHAFLIKCSFKRFLSVFTNIKLKKDEEICPYCFLKITDKIKYIHHKKNYCSTRYSCTELKYPELGAKRKFINYGRCEMFRFIQFFDFEAYLKDNGKDKIHHPVSFSEITLDTKTNQIISNKSYLGENYVDVF